MVYLPHILIYCYVLSGTYSTRDECCGVSPKPLLFCLSHSGYSFYISSYYNFVKLFLIFIEQFFNVQLWLTMSMIYLGLVMFMYVVV